jgi:hypothetical protein
LIIIIIFIEKIKVQLKNGNNLLKIQYGRITQQVNIIDFYKPLASDAIWASTENIIEKV